MNNSYLFLESGHEYFSYTLLFFFSYLLMLYSLFPNIFMGWINQACVIIFYFWIFFLRNAMLFMKHNFFF